MNANRKTAGEGQGGALASPRPYAAGTNGGARAVYRPTSPAGESLAGLLNLVRAWRLDAAVGAEKI